MKNALTLSSVFAIALLTPTLLAHADSLTPSGDVTVVTGSNGSPAWQLSTDSSTSGTLTLNITGTLTVAEITTLSADYQMLTGTFAGGSPRFSLVSASGAAFVYFGDPAGTDSNSGAYGNTGNYANLSSTDLRVEDDGGFGAGDVYSETWAQFVGTEGSVDVSSIDLVLDGGWSEAQIADIENFDLNGAIYNPSVAATPEPASLLLLATGLFGAAGEAFRRSRRNAS